MNHIEGLKRLKFPVMLNNSSSPAEGEPVWLRSSITKRY